MARVTTEDCITSIPNRFQLVIYACNRARDLSSGSQAEVSIDDDKNTVIALREIAEKKIDLVKTWDSIVVSSQRYQPVEDTDIDDNETVPMNANASQVSFDNFEKENASEKNRKKISVTESDIKKLIENNRKEMLEKKTDDTDFDSIDGKEEIIQDRSKID